MSEILDSAHGSYGQYRFSKGSRSVQNTPPTNKGGSSLLAAARRLFTNTPPTNQGGSSLLAAARRLFTKRCAESVDSQTLNLLVARFTNTTCVLHFCRIPITSEVTAMFEKTIKNFAINFNCFNGRTTFASGDLLTGQLSFELAKETKISYIMVVAVGKAEVHWSSSSGSGKRRRRTSHSATVEFFKLKSTIMEVDGGTLSVSFALQLGLSKLWEKPHTLSFSFYFFPLSRHRINKTSARYSRVPALMSASARVRMSSI